MAKVEINCADCGEALEVVADTPDARVPCPKCGGTKRVYHASMTGGVPSNYLLDNFVAHKLSLLTECGAAELTVEPNWLNSFILTTVFNVSLEPKIRAYLFNFIRRAEGALSAYPEAREALIEYVQTPRNVLSPYFRALLKFEVCISQCYQGYLLLAAASGVKLFERADGSPEQRLNVLYNDSKHMNERIEQGEMPTEATSAIWITNQGLESKGATLLFEELREMLVGMECLAKRLSVLKPPPKESETAQVTP